MNIKNRQTQRDRKEAKEGENGKFTVSKKQFQFEVMKGFGNSGDDSPAWCTSWLALSWAIRRG